MPFLTEDKIAGFLKTIETGIGNYKQTKTNFHKNKPFGSYGTAGLDRATAFEFVFSNNKIETTTKLVFAYALLVNSKGSNLKTDVSNALQSFLSSDGNDNVQTLAEENLIQELFDLLTALPTISNPKYNPDKLDDSIPSIISVAPKKQAIFKKEFQQLLTEIYQLFNSGKASKEAGFHKLQGCITRVNDFISRIEKHRKLLNYYIALKNSIKSKDGFQSTLDSIPKESLIDVLLLYRYLEGTSLLQTIISRNISLIPLENLIEKYPILLQPITDVQGKMISFDKEDKTPLFTAVTQGETPIINFLMTCATSDRTDSSNAGKSFSITHKDFKGSTLLHQAAERGTVDPLVNSNLNPQLLLTWLYTSNAELQTPLHVAISVNNFNSFFPLLNLLDRTQPGLTTAVFLQGENNENILHFTLRAYAKALGKENSSDTHSRYTKMLTKLLERIDGNALMQRNHSNQTPLQLAQELELPQNIIDNLQQALSFKTYHNTSRTLHSLIDKHYLVRLKNRLNKAVDRYREEGSEKKKYVPAETGFAQDLNIATTFNQILIDTGLQKNSPFTAAILQRLHAAAQQRITNLLNNDDQQIKTFHASLEPIQEEAAYDPQKIKNLAKLLIDAIQKSDYSLKFSTTVGVYDRYYANLKQYLESFKDESTGNHLAHLVMGQLKQATPEQLLELYDRIMFLACITPDLFNVSNNNGQTPIEIAQQNGFQFNNLIPLVSIAKDSTSDLIAGIEGAIPLTPQENVLWITHYGIKDHLQKIQNKPKEEIVIAMAQRKQEVNRASVSQNIRHQCYVNIFEAIKKVIGDEATPWHVGLKSKKITITSKSGTTSKSVPEHIEIIWKTLQSVSEASSLENYKIAKEEIVSQLQKVAVVDLGEKPENTFSSTFYEMFFGQRNWHTQKFYNELNKALLNIFSDLESSVSKISSSPDVASFVDQILDQISSQTQLMQANLISLLAG